MIEKTTGFKIGDSVFTTLEQAQKHGIRDLLSTANSFTESGGQLEISDAVALIVQHSDRVVDLLTTNAKSRAKARKINGAKRTRKATAPVVPWGNGAGVIGKGVAS